MKKIILLLLATLLTANAWAFGGGGSGRTAQNYERAEKGVDSVGVHVDPDNPIEEPEWRDCDEEEVLIIGKCCPKKLVYMDGEIERCCDKDGWVVENGACVPGKEIESCGDKVCLICERCNKEKTECEPNPEKIATSCSEHKVCSPDGACLCEETYALSADELDKNTYTYEECTDVNGTHYKKKGCTGGFALQPDGSCSKYCDYGEVRNAAGECVCADGMIPYCKRVGSDGACSKKGCCGSEHLSPEDASGRRVCCAGLSAGGEPFCASGVSKCEKYECCFGEIAYRQDAEGHGPMQICCERDILGNTKSARFWRDGEIQDFNVCCPENQIEEEGGVKYCCNERDSQGKCKSVCPDKGKEGKVNKQVCCKNGLALNKQGQYALLDIANCDCPISDREQGEESNGECCLNGFAWGGIAYNKGSAACCRELRPFYYHLSAWTTEINYINGYCCSEGFNSIETHTVPECCQDAGGSVVDGHCCKGEEDLWAPAENQRRSETCCEKAGKPFVCDSRHPGTNWTELGWAIYGAVPGVSSAWEYPAGVVMAVIDWNWRELPIVSDVLAIQAALNSEAGDVSCMPDMESCCAKLGGHICKTFGEPVCLPKDKPCCPSGTVEANNGTTCVCVNGDTAIETTSTSGEKGYTCCPEALVATKDGLATCCENNKVPSGPNGAQICCNANEENVDGECVAPCKAPLVWSKEVGECVAPCSNGNVTKVCCDAMNGRYEEDQETGKATCCIDNEVVAMNWFERLFIRTAHAASVCYSGCAEGFTDDGSGHCVKERCPNGKEWNEEKGICECLWGGEPSKTNPDICCRDKLAFTEKWSLVTPTYNTVNIDACGCPEDGEIQKNIVGHSICCKGGYKLSIQFGIHEYDSFDYHCGCPDGGEPSKSNPKICCKNGLSWQDPIHSNTPLGGRSGGYDAHTAQCACPEGATQSPNPYFPQYCCKDGYRYLWDEKRYEKAPWFCGCPQNQEIVNGACCKTDKIITNGDDKTCCDGENLEIVEISGVKQCKEKCPAGQTHDSVSGQCVCIAKGPEYGCENGKVWDSDNCKCVCPDGGTESESDPKFCCKNNKIWDNYFQGYTDVNGAICKCPDGGTESKTDPSECCKNNKKWNIFTEDYTEVNGNICECSVSEPEGGCGDGKAWSADSCSCACIATEPEGGCKDGTWDAETCACKSNSEPPCELSNGNVTKECCDARGGIYKEDEKTHRRECCLEDEAIAMNWLERLFVKTAHAAATCYTDCMSGYEEDEQGNCEPYQDPNCPEYFAEVSEGVCCSTSRYEDGEGFLYNFATGKVQVFASICGCPKHTHPSDSNADSCCIDGEVGKLYNPNAAGGWEMNAACGCVRGTPGDADKCCENGFVVDDEKGDYVDPLACKCPQEVEPTEKNGYLFCCKDGKKWSDAAQDYTQHEMVCGCPEYFGAMQPKEINGICCVEELGKELVTISYPAMFKINPVCGCPELGGIKGHPSDDGQTCCGENGLEVSNTIGDFQDYSRPSTICSEECPTVDGITGKRMLNLRVENGTQSQVCCGSNGLALSEASSWDMFDGWEEREYRVVNPTCGCPKGKDGGVGTPDEGGFGVCCKNNLAWDLDEEDYTSLAPWACDCPRTKAGQAGELLEGGIGWACCDPKTGYGYNPDSKEYDKVDGRCGCPVSPEYKIPGIPVNQSCCLHGWGWDGQEYRVVNPDCGCPDSADEEKKGKQQQIADRCCLDGYSYDDKNKFDYVIPDPICGCPKDISVVGYSEYQKYCCSNETKLAYNALADKWNLLKPIACDCPDGRRIKGGWCCSSENYLYGENEPLQVDIELCGCPTKDIEVTKFNGKKLCCNSVTKLAYDTLNKPTIFDVDCGCPVVDGIQTELVEPEKQIYNPAGEGVLKYCCAEGFVLRRKALEEDEDPSGTTWEWNPVICDCPNEGRLADDDTTCCKDGKALAKSDNGLFDYIEEDDICAALENCPDGKERDSTSGECACTAKEPEGGCGEGKQWNEETCSCECIKGYERDEAWNCVPKPCEAPATWNEDEKHCVCPDDTDELVDAYNAEGELEHQVCCPKGHQADANGKCCEADEKNVAGVCCAESKIIVQSDKRSICCTGGTFPTYDDSGVGECCNESETYCPEWDGIFCKRQGCCKGVLIEEDDVSYLPHYSCCPTEKVYTETDKWGKSIKKCCTEGTVNENGYCTSSEEHNCENDIFGGEWYCVWENPDGSCAKGGCCDGVVSGKDVSGYRRCCTGDVEVVPWCKKKLANGECGEYDCCWLDESFINTNGSCEQKDYKCPDEEGERYCWHENQDGSCIDYDCCLGTVSEKAPNGERRCCDEGTPYWGGFESPGNQSDLHCCLPGGVLSPKTWDGAQTCCRADETPYCSTKQSGGRCAIYDCCKGEVNAAGDECKSCEDNEELVDVYDAKGELARRVCCPSGRQADANGNCCKEGEKNASGVCCDAAHIAVQSDMTSICCPEGTKPFYNDQGMAECRKDCESPLEWDSEKQKCMCPEGVEPTEKDDKKYCCSYSFEWDGRGYNLIHRAICGCSDGYHDPSEGFNGCCASDNTFISDGDEELIGHPNIAACGCVGNDQPSASGYGCCGAGGGFYTRNTYYDDNNTERINIAECGCVEDWYEVDGEWSEKEGKSVKMCCGTTEHQGIVDGAWTVGYTSSPSIYCCQDSEGQWHYDDEFCCTGNGGDWTGEICCDKYNSGYTMSGEENIACGCPEGYHPADDNATCCSNENNGKDITGNDNFETCGCPTDTQGNQGELMSDVCCWDHKAWDGHSYSEFSLSCGCPTGYEPKNALTMPSATVCCNDNFELMSLDDGSWYKAGFTPAACGCPLSECGFTWDENIYTCRNDSGALISSGEDGNGRYWMVRSPATNAGDECPSYAGYDYVPESHNEYICCYLKDGAPYQAAMAKDRGGVTTGCGQYDVKPYSYPWCCPSGTVYSMSSGKCIQSSACAGSIDEDVLCHDDVQ